MILGADQVYELVRKLAKNPYYQSIYGQAKEIGVRLFKNETDLTKLQVTFLGYLAFYADLNLDVYMGEVDEIIFDDFIYEDAYAYYKRQERTKKKSSTPSVIHPGKQTEKGNSFSWVFKTPHKRK